MTIEEIFSGRLAPGEQLAALRQPKRPLRPWEGPCGLKREYDPLLHPVMDRAAYPDLVDGGMLVRVSRVPLNFQRLACNRLSELVCGLPVRRVYDPQSEVQKRAATRLEAIFRRVRIDSVNTMRTRTLFACCEFFTLWYAAEEANSLYGFDSPLKLRCRTFSPMDGSRLWPFFDRDGDMKAFSIERGTRVGDRTVNTFDTYTAERHLQWSDAGGVWRLVADERHSLGRIPGIYVRRDTPAWEDTTPMVTEMEWSLSRNGNYLRENSKPRFVVYADEIISYGDEKRPEREFKSVMQYPAGGRAEYVTWPQATENLRFYIEQLRNLFFTQLQLPDWSYEKMSQQALSGESRKQMFIDAELKVRDEAGVLEEGFDREANVVKAFLRLMSPASEGAEIESLAVESVVTPFRIEDEQEKTTVLMTANGGRPLISHRESIERYGASQDPERTLEEIRSDSVADNAFGQ